MSMLFLCRSEGKHSSPCHLNAGPPSECSTIFTHLVPRVRRRVRRRRDVAGLLLPRGRAILGASRRLGVLLKELQVSVVAGPLLNLLPGLLIRLLLLLLELLILLLEGPHLSYPVLLNFVKPLVELLVAHGLLVLVVHLAVPLPVLPPLITVGLRRGPDSLRHRRRRHRRRRRIRRRLGRGSVGHRRRLVLCVGRGSRVGRGGRVGNRRRVGRRRGVGGIGVGDCGRGLVAHGGGLRVDSARLHGPPANIGGGCESCPGLRRHIRYLVRRHGSCSAGITTA
mmetsp:Transcript_2308/g.5108  ORF Transcript_2308/g.5108 Transcript_2308/m.5108 type:complete len:281 (+) Transcript_2308:129-971(+)